MKLIVLFLIPICTCDVYLLTTSSMLVLDGAFMRVSLEEGGVYSDGGFI